MPGKDERAGHALRDSLGGRVRYLRKRWRWLRTNVAGALRARRELHPVAAPVADLNRYERRVRSQNGEDGILDALFTILGTTNRTFVEFGAGRGYRSTAAHLLLDRGWTGLMMDGSKTSRSHPDLRQEFVTAENIEALLAKHAVPHELDLLVIDIDGNDYWVWKAITRHRARVVVVEYNPSVPPGEARVLPYDPAFVWDRTDYYGASLLALARLGAERGYRLVACDNSGTNAFFVDAALAEGRLVRRSVEELYRPASREGGRGHAPSGRQLMPI